LLHPAESENKYSLESIMAQSNRFRILAGLAVAAISLFCAAGEDTWIEVKSPNFVVISNASAKQARRTARSFEQFRSLLLTVLPKLKVDPGSPLVVLAARNSGSLDGFLPLEQEKGAVKRVGIFVQGPESNTVILRTDVPGDQGYHVIYHEYVHMVMRLNFQRLPLWLSEGLAEFFGYASISNGTSGLGNASPELLQFLQTASMVPLTTLLTVTHDSPYYHQQDKAQIFYAQSWALTHYLMVGDKQAHSGQLIEFIRLLQTDIAEDEAVARAFGDLKVLERNLRNYVHMKAFYHYQIPAQLGIKEDQYTVRTLSPAESLAWRGQVLVQANRLDDAKPMLEQSLQLDSHSALANEGMGLLFMLRQQREQAMKYFSAAAESDSKNLLSHFYAAQLAWEHGDLTASESHLRKAVAINPSFLPACKNLSQLLMNQTEKQQEALELAQKVADLEPAEMSNRIQIGRILISMEKYDEASRLAKNLLALARNDADRREVETLLDLIKTRQEMIHNEQRRAEAVKEQIRQIEEQRQAEVETRPQRANEEPIKTGPAGKVGGIIRSVKCGYPAVMDIVIENNGDRRKLRAQNYFQVQYWAVDAPGKTDFQPCEELEGKRVQIEFLSVSGQEFSGLIKTVAIEK
jgi:tetratricopeptide (TPR) repeat protein